MTPSKILYWVIVTISILVLLTVIGCSTAAEFDRPEDVTVLRASYTKVSAIYSIFVGGTEVCQITALDRKGANVEGNETAAQILADYSVVLDQDGCAILPRNLLKADIP